MARKTMSTKTDVSLFPFLSILCALIGVLVLVLVALTVGQVENTSASQDIPITDIILESLEVERLVNLKLDEKDPQKLKERVQNELEQLRAQAQAIDPDLLKREMQISDRIVVEPTGTGQNRKAYFIECTEYAVLIPEEGSRIGKLDILNSRRLRDVLNRYKVIMQDDYVGLDLDIQAEEAAPGKGWDVIFLVRPDGVETFKLVESVAKEMQAKYATIPIPGFAPLNLSLFGADRH